MKKISITIATLLLAATSFANSAAGVAQISSNQLTCKSGSVSLTVDIVNNDHLQATLVDASDLKSTFTFQSKVSASNDGYTSQSMRIYMDKYAEYQEIPKKSGSKSKKHRAPVFRTVMVDYALVVIGDDNSTDEPRIYSYLKCEPISIK